VSSYLVSSISDSAMTHPELIRLEDLVNRLLERMHSQEDDSGPELVNAAREYAEACETVNARLQTCLDILSKGRDKEHQALMAATRQPDLLDACAVLSELQTEEYGVFCRRNFLPTAPGLNERAKQEVDPLYARAGSFQKKLRMEFSAANSKRDFREALEICRQLAKVDPSDIAAAKQVAALEERLVQEVLAKKIQPALDKGDEETAVAALAEIDLIAPGRQPRSDERSEKVWIEAIAARDSMEREDAIRASANLLIQAEAARDSGNLEMVLEVLARIGSLIEKHSFSLSQERESLFRDLNHWKDEALRKSRIEENFLSAIDELKVLLKKIADKDFQNTAPTFAEHREDALGLQRLWKEIAEYKKPVDSDLQERARKILGALNEKIDRHTRSKRRSLILIISGATVVVVTAAIFAVMFTKAGKMADRISSAQEDMRAEDLRDALSSFSESDPSWRSFGSLPRTKNNAVAWLDEQKALVARMTGVLAEIRNDIDSRTDLSSWSPVSLLSLKTRIDDAAKEIEPVNQNDRIPLDDNVASLSLSLDGLIDHRRNEIVEAFHARVEPLDRLVREELRFDRPIAAVAESLTKVNTAITEMEGMATSEMESLRPSASDLAKFEVLKARFVSFDTELEKVREIMTKCGGVDSLKAYAGAIRELNGTEFLKGEEKINLANLVVEFDSGDRVFREILMPGAILSWKNLTERNFTADAYPGDISATEEVAFLTLRDDDSLNEMYLYEITEGGKTRKIFSRGGTMQGVDLNSAGSIIYDLLGTEVYDPSGASLTTVTFIERKYRQEKRAAGTRGTLPVGGKLSPESAFFTSLKLANYVTGDFSKFQKSFLTLAEAVLNAPEDLNPVFRAYLFLEIAKLMQPRREKWLLDFCDFDEDFSTLQGIVGAALSSSDWCSPAQTERHAEKVNAFFSERKGRKYVDGAKAVYGFYARVYTGGLVYCGHQDHTDSLKLVGPTDTSNVLWGFDDKFKVAKVFLKDPSGGWTRSGPIAKFSPLFYIRVNPEDTWISVAKANFVDPSNPSLRQKLPKMLGFGKELE